MNKSFFERSGVRTMIVLFGGMVVDRLQAYLTGSPEPWAPIALAALVAAWHAYKDPSMKPPPISDDAVVVRPPAPPAAN